MTAKSTTEAGRAGRTRRGLLRRQMLCEGSALLGGVVVSGVAATSKSGLRNRLLKTTTGSLKRISL
jgi:hypothetical protein